MRRLSERLLPTPVLLSTRHQITCASRLLGFSLNFDPRSSDMRVFYALSTALACVASASASAPPLIGNVSAVYALLERVIPGSSPHFALSLLPPAQACAAGVAAPCFVLSPGSAPGAEVALAGSSASELSAGVGHYLREYLNMTIGWPRGGGSNVFSPAAWPAPPAAGDARARVVPWVRSRRSLCRRRARSPPQPLPPRARALPAAAFAAAARASRLCHTRGFSPPAVLRHERLHAFVLARVVRLACVGVLL